VIGVVLYAASTMLRSAFAKDEARPESDPFLIPNSVSDEN